MKVKVNKPFRAVGVDDEYKEFGKNPLAERSVCDTCIWFNKGIPCGTEPGVCKRKK